MASKTEICNMAISHLGIGKEIANIVSDRSEEASACRRFFETAKEAQLKDHWWNFAKRQSVLNLVQENPNDEWLYSFRYPVDCLEVRFVSNGQISITQDQRVSYEIGSDASGLLIFCNEPSVTISYTRNLVDTNLFSPEFVLALSFKVAAYIALRLTGGDPFKLKGEMLEQYNLELGMAKKADSIEGQRPVQPMTPGLKARL